MTVKVRIPEPLRRATKGEGLVEVKAGTIAQCIEELEAQFPGLKERLMADSGELRHFVNVFVNGEDVRFLQGLDTSLSPGDEVSIVPAVAGG
ncbi:MAG: MoaD/ThiS family protein [Chloroflexi bacterium]|nr:MoaD/ThiS family protein [Chloroflexota bacterium]